MSLIKDIYSTAFYERFANTLKHIIPAFSEQQFIKSIFDERFRSREWKDRMKHTTAVLHQFLPADFPAAVALIMKIIDRLKAEHQGEDNLAYIFFADYIETYGLDDFEHSVSAFEFITQFISCEFAVRPFILKYEDKMIRQMFSWSNHESHKVRRLATEGCRPRLPWAMAIPSLKKDPSPILPILENLKNDPSESVRRSVANNLNDIAKDHPGIVCAIALKWKNTSRETDAVIKHGCRTLLKQGHKEILEHYGLGSQDIVLSDFRILTPQVNTGDSLDFGFAITNRNKTTKMVRLEYGLYYKKANGSLAKKVFKISEKEYQPGEIVNIRRKQSFRLITTRKFYPGEHQLSIIINGDEQEKKEFILAES